MLQPLYDSTKDMRTTSEPQEWIYSGEFAEVALYFPLCKLCKVSVLTECMFLSVVIVVIPFQNPKDFYLVGNTVEYSCIWGHYLNGDAMAECTGNGTWRTGARVCKSTSSLH